MKRLLADVLRIAAFFAGFGYMYFSFALEATR